MNAMKCKSLEKQIKFVENIERRCCEFLPWTENQYDMPFIVNVIGSKRKSNVCKIFLEAHEEQLSTIEEQWKLKQRLTLKLQSIKKKQLILCFQHFDSFFFIVSVGPVTFFLFFRSRDINFNLKLTLNLRDTPTRGWKMIYFIIL